MLVEEQRGQLGATSMFGFHDDIELDLLSIGVGSGIGGAEDWSCNICSSTSPPIILCLCGNIFTRDI